MSDDGERQGYYLFELERVIGYRGLKTGKRSWVRQAESGGSGIGKNSKGW